MIHPPTKCPRNPNKPSIYVGRGYKAEFKCPVCERATYQHLNFLGRRNVICDGRVFSKEARA